MLSAGILMLKLEGKESPPVMLFAVAVITIVLSFKCLDAIIVKFLTHSAPFIGNERLDDVQLLSKERLTAVGGGMLVTG